jgi:hypothetical protein
MMGRQRDETEDDVGDDTAQALSRETGGVPATDDPDQRAPDRHSTTGTTPNDTFVGRVAGQDPGYVGETGAERRAEEEQRGDER